MKKTGLGAGQLAAALMLAAAGWNPAGAEDASGAGAVTWARDVAPIMATRCVACHRPGEVAPMSLMTYEDARPWAKSIKQAVAARVMPPWGVNPAHGSFANDMALSESEIATIAAWVDQGAKPGELAEAPEMPAAVEGWKLGEPDYVIELPETQVPAETEDLFPTFNVRLNLPEDKWVQAVEFLPGEKSVVHHIVANLGLSGMGDKDAGNGGGASQLSTTGEPSEIFGIYVAGVQPTEYEAGAGRTVRSDQLMSFNVHYHANGEATTDRTRIGLHFGEGELQKNVSTIGGIDLGFRCPPGDSNFEVRSFYVFDQDTRILSFNPHMHVRGKDFRYELVRPDGGREILLDIPKYDYDWQWIYYPTAPIEVQAGSRVEIVSHMDNSSANPDNPDPGAALYHRGPTFQEMSIGFMEVIPEEGVDFTPLPAREKVIQLVNLHPAADSYLVSFFGLPVGLYLPRTGENGVWYTARGVLMIQATIRDIVWTGNTFTAESTMAMPDGGGVSLLMSGTIGEDGKLTGKFDMGGRPEKQDPAMYPALVLPVTGSRVEAPREVAAQ